MTPQSEVLGWLSGRKASCHLRYVTTLRLPCWKDDNSPAERPADGRLRLAAVRVCHLGCPAQQGSQVTSAPASVSITSPETPRENRPDKPREQNQMVLLNV